MVDIVEGNESLDRMVAACRVAAHGYIRSIREESEKRKDFSPYENITGYKTDEPLPWEEPDSGQPEDGFQQHTIIFDPLETEDEDILTPTINIPPLETLLGPGIDKEQGLRIRVSRKIYEILSHPECPLTGHSHLGSLYEAGKDKELRPTAEGQRHFSSIAEQVTLKILPYLMDTPGIDAGGMFQLKIPVWFEKIEEADAYRVLVKSKRPFDVTRFLPDTTGKTEEQKTAAYDVLNRKIAGETILRNMHAAGNPHLDYYVKIIRDFIKAAEERPEEDDMVSDEPAIMLLDKLTASITDAMLELKAESVMPVYLEGAFTTSIGKDGVQEPFITSISSIYLAPTGDKQVLLPICLQNADAKLTAESLDAIVKGMVDTAVYDIIEPSMRNIRGHPEYGLCFKTMKGPEGREYKVLTDKGASILGYEISNISKSLVVLALNSRATVKNRSAEYLLDVQYRILDDGSFRITAFGPRFFRPGLYTVPYRIDEGRIEKLASDDALAYSAAERQVLAALANNLAQANPHALRRYFTASKGSGGGSPSLELNEEGKRVLGSIVESNSRGVAEELKQFAQKGGGGEYLLVCNFRREDVDISFGKKVKQGQL